MAREIGCLTAEVTGLRQDFRDTCERLNKYSDRIRALESWRIWILGAAAAVAAAAGLAVRMIP
jgi:hypothetical protein